MLLQRLKEYYERIEKTGDLVPEYHKASPVRWFLDITKQGDFTCVVETRGAGKSGRKKHKELQVPYFKRSGKQPPPFLVVDRSDYVLGLAVPDKASSPEHEAEKASRNHRFYVELVKQCAGKTGLDSVEAVIRFLENQAAVEEAHRELKQEARKLKKGDLIAFRVDGRIVTDNPRVRSFWQELQRSRGGGKKVGKKKKGGKEEEDQCMLCEQFGPTLENHPVELRLGGERPALVCFNANAFVSFGLKRAQNAPLCLSCAMAYGRALESLFQSKQNCLRVGQVFYVFWTREEEAGFSVLALLNEADPAEVRKLLKAPFAPTEPALVETADFFALAVSANKSRLVVRDWLETTLAVVQIHLRRYFELQELVDAHGGEGIPVGLFPLLASVVRDPNKELSSRLVSAFLAAALRGSPLPRWLLQLAVRRAQVDEHHLTRPRAVLLKMCLNTLQEERFMVEPSLDINHPDPGYHLGRLLRVLESIQERAIPGIKATLVDRCFGTASSAPAAIFGTLLRQSQAHLSKLRKEKPGLHHLFQGKLESVCGQLQGFPATLSLEQQALFGLGYYHQRAEDRAAMQRAKEAKKQADKADENDQNAQGD